MAEERNTVTITLDGVDVEVEAGQPLIDAAQMAGTYIPRFCYHPRMSPVGMCRQCMVEVEGPRGPMMVVSCMTPVADGQVVRTDTPQVKRAQEGMLELLLANHPLDCPVCDQAGECYLQDYSLEFGEATSRMVEPKNKNPKKDIGSKTLLYQDRCVMCSRCVRFLPRTVRGTVPRADSIPFGRSSRRCPARSSRDSGRRRWGRP